MMPEIDALTAYTATALEAPLDAEAPSLGVEVRQLAIRALADANELRLESEIARARCEAALEKHHELIALAERMKALDTQFVAGERKNEIRPI